MGDLGEILNKRQFQEPPEVKAIKEYIGKHFKATVRISVTPESIVVIAGSSSLANALRLSSRQISTECGVDRPLIFRIG